MKKTILLKSLFLLCALIVGSSCGWAANYVKYSGAITEGDYVIYYDGKAMKNTISSNRFTYSSVSPSENIISNPSDDIVWHIAADGDYWTIYNASADMYAAGTSSKNQGALLESVTDYARWTVTGTATYEFENKARAAAASDNDKKWLRNNGTYGFATYSSSTGGALTLYKKATPAVAYTVTYGDATGGSIKEASAGAGVTLANRDVPIGSFYTFEGWSETNLTIETTSATIIKTDATYYPSKDVTLYPVYSRTVAASVMPDASVTISDYATDHSWSNGTQYTSITINGDIEATCSSSGNNGKYYGDWRMYRSDNGTVTITAADGYILTSVTFTFSVAKNGAFYYDTTQLTSETAQDVTGKSATFTVKNTNSDTNGQVKITAIEVAYKKVAVTYYTSLPDEEETKEVTSFGWATYIPAHAVSFGAGCAFVVTDASTTIKLTEVAKVPAGTPVILKKAAGGDIDATVINESPAAPATNLLSIGGATIPSGKEAWVLAKNGVGNACFKLWEGTASVLEGRVVFLNSATLLQI